MMHDQSKRWVLVTGASGGIGQAIGQVLAAAGFGVIAGSRAAPDALATGGPTQVRTLALDLTSEASVRAAVDKTHEITAGALFALVNNAGIALPGAFELSSLADARRQIETNVYGTLSLTHALLPSLRANRGRLVVVTSVVGRLAMPFNAVHCGTKHFLEGMFSSLRIELRRTGVHTVIIEPGTIHTPMIEKFSAAAERALTQVPPELDAMYGRPLRSMVARMQRHIATGSPPEVVAEAVLRALSAPQPRSHYAVGRLARRTVTLAKLLPERTKDRLVSRMLNI
jgi:NAD(P)-dependent dehydrogenase (short-subunit alcohol dehydrogenase family)